MTEITLDADVLRMLKKFNTAKARKNMWLNDIQAAFLYFGELVEPEDLDAVIEWLAVLVSHKFLSVIERQGQMIDKDQAWTSGVLKFYVITEAGRDYLQSKPKSNKPICHKCLKG